MGTRAFHFSFVLIACAFSLHAGRARAAAPTTPWISPTGAATEVQATAQANCDAPHVDFLMQLAAGVVAVDVAACQQDYTQNKCDELKGSLPDDKKGNVMNCQAGVLPANFLVGCGQGMVGFVVDTAKGIVSTIADTGKFYRECAEKPEMRRAMLSSVAMLFPPSEVDTMVNTMTCDAIGELVQYTTNDAMNRIAEKKRMQDYAAHRTQAPAQPLPKEFEITPGEHLFMQGQLANGPEILGVIWNEVSQRMACYTPQARVAMTCQIATGIATGAFLALKGAELTAKISDLLGKALPKAGAALTPTTKVIPGVTDARGLSILADDNIANIPIPPTVSAASIANDARLGVLDSYVPRVVPGKTAAIDQTQAQSLFQKIADHPVTGMCALPQYDPWGSVGFCHGRASAYFIEGLKTGINKDSMRKVWVNGGFKDAENNWSYHVATIVRSSDGGWWALDPAKFSGPVKVQEWASAMNSMSGGKPYNLFVTDPTRVSIGQSKPLYFDGWTKTYYQDYLYEVRKEIRANMNGR